jgi:hypothetical protein
MSPVAAAWSLSQCQAPSKLLGTDRFLNGLKDKKTPKDIKVFLIREVVIYKSSTLTVFQGQPSWNAILRRPTLLSTLPKSYKHDRGYFSAQSKAQKRKSSTSGLCFMHRPKPLRYRRLDTNSPSLSLLYLLCSLILPYCRVGRYG